MYFGMLVTGSLLAGFFGAIGVTVAVSLLRYALWRYQVHAQAKAIKAQIVALNQVPGLKVVQGGKADDWGATKEPVYLDQVATTDETDPTKN